jgi:hypothetical protein
MGHRCLYRGFEEYFNSVRAFCRHRVWVSRNVPRCVSQSQMGQKGMTVNAAGFWITKTYVKHRVQPAISRILATLTDAPVGYQGGARICRKQRLPIAEAEG